MIKDIEQVITLLRELLAAPAISALIGGAIALVGSLFIDWSRFKRERKYRAEAVFSAIKAEIASIVSLMEFADYEKGLRFAASEIERTGRPYFYEVPVKIELFTKVYAAHLSDLGILNKDIVPLIVAFYAQVHGLVMDLENVKPPKHGDSQYSESDMVCNQTRTYKADIIRVPKVIALGKKISEMNLNTADSI